MKKALIAMSGGVDSSVAAFLTKQQGYYIEGVTLKLCSTEEDEPSCCTSKDIEDARSVCEKLGIPHRVINFTDDFNKKVIDKFVNTYIEGGTPNPCVDCNRFIKFSKLFEIADEEGFDYVVSGHYAKVCFDEASGRYSLKKGTDESKDQSYVLYSLTEKQLSKLLFPLGDMTKEKIRKIAEDEGLINADKPDSQDICFIKNGKHGEFIEKYTGKKSPEGDFVDLNGNKLGTHKGIINYTIGQRKGLGLALKQSMFVVKKDIKANKVILGYTEDLMSKSFIAGDINLIAFDELNEKIRATVKTRYKQKEAPATLVPLENGKIEVVFDEPQRAIARGQAAVFYQGDKVIGGGTIE
ncbi:MAG: tRNA 2-thiouridine(34) synthase MnmA [Ruminococcaceae bacterium]|nr:tRNA 2-thiouridine(34) synthase MnmA [Oscillospiraceae bacterium]